MYRTYVMYFSYLYLNYTTSEFPLVMQSSLRGILGLGNTITEDIIQDVLIFTIIKMELFNYGR